MTNYGITEYFNKAALVAAEIADTETFTVLPYWDGKRTRFMMVNPAPNLTV